ncbi:MAG TPA: hypothetical protein PL041_08620 [Melioribacteraceae bacterium]|nr:hypothetical protein [Melioribacteraceae bacterium]
MRTIEIIRHAIYKRNRMEFEVNDKRITFDPYLIAKNKEGNYVIFGRVNNSNSVKSFEIDLLKNIRLINNYQFSPLIPILPAI